ncbi:hypothetical protein CTI14_40515, partial [Methylobacterium radiotolerans]
ATPVNWEDGDDVIIVPSLQDEAVIKEKFPKGYNGQLSDHRRQGPQGLRAVRHDPPECQRHGDRAFGVRHRSEQEGPPDHHVSRQHGPQFQ